MRNLKGWRGDISHQESKEKEKKKEEREGGSFEFSNDNFLKHNRKVIENSLIKGRREGWEKKK